MTNYLADEHCAVRHVPFQLIDRDDNETVRGVFPQAFELRPGEEYLSACWLEYFDASYLGQLSAIAISISRTRKVTAKQAFATGKVGDIKEACGEFGLKIRVIHEPNEDNPAYVAVRRYKSEDVELLSLLASNAWASITESSKVCDLIGPWPRAMP
jgi:hypothetical protein